MSARRKAARRKSLTVGMMSDLIAHLDKDHPSDRWEFTPRRRRQIVSALRHSMADDAASILSELVRLKKIRTELDSYDRHVHPESACARDIGGSVAAQREKYEDDKRIAWDRAFALVAAMTP